MVPETPENELPTQVETDASVSSPAEEPSSLTAPHQAAAEQASDISSAPAAKLSRYERRELAAADALRTLIRDLYLEQFRKPAEKAQGFKMALDITIDPSDNWKLVFEPNLQEQVRGAVSDVEAVWGMYQQGRVFDFHADSARSEKSVPPSATMVFAGYDSFGAPKWCEFSQMMIDLQDPRVDKLYESRAPALNVVMFGKQLKADQLSSYGKASKTYSVLGQVAFGFLQVPRAKQRMKAHGDKLAITFQFVETRNEGGQFELRVNTLAGLYELEEVEELLMSERNSWIYHAREAAVRKLETIRNRALAARESGNQDAYNDAMKGIGGVLRGFSKSLERGNRQAKRRTNHAVKRKNQTERPTHKAMDDVKVADASMVYHDTRHDSYVVLGKPNRVHAFSKKGKHITSFTIKPDAVDYRKRTQRWAVLSGDEAETIKQAVVSVSSDAPSE